MFYVLKRFAWVEMINSPFQYSNLSYITILRRNALTNRNAYSVRKIHSNIHTFRTHRICWTALETPLLTSRDFPNKQEILERDPWELGVSIPLNCDWRPFTRPPRQTGRVRKIESVWQRERERDWDRERERERERQRQRQRQRQTQKHRESKRERESVSGDRETLR